MLRTSAYFGARRASVLGRREDGFRSELRTFAARSPLSPFGGDAVLFDWQRALLDRFGSGADSIAILVVYFELWKLV